MATALLCFSLGLSTGYVLWEVFSTENCNKRRERKHAQEFDKRLNKAAAAMLKDPSLLQSLQGEVDKGKVTFSRDED